MKKNYLTFFVIASILTACNIEEEGIDANSKIYIESKYGNQLISNYDEVFIAKDASGNDISTNVTFYIDGTAQASNVLRFAQSGTYQVSANITLDGTVKESDPLSINVIEPRHSTKILIEDFTGTWCVNCPRVAFKLDEAVQNDNHIIPVGVHFSRWSGDDPFGYDNINDLKTAYNISAFPTPLVNRDFVWDEQVSSLQNILQQNQAMGLSISSSVSGNNLTVDVKTRFDMDFSNDDIFVVVYIAENGLHADQSNSTSYYGGQDPIPNFEHNHSLRTALTGINGVAIPHTDSNTNDIYTYHFSGAIPSQVTDINNCEIIAFIGDNNTPLKVINVQKAEIGIVKDFD